MMSRGGRMVPMGEQDWTLSVCMCSADLTNNGSIMHAVRNHRRTTILDHSHDQRSISIDSVSDSGVTLRRAVRPDPDPPAARDAPPDAL